MAELTFGMSGNFVVPEGTVVDPETSEFVLPDGNRFKIWAVVEHTTDPDNEEVYQNLNYAEAEGHGIIMEDNWVDYLNVIQFGADASA